MSSNTVVYQDFHQQLQDPNAWIEAAESSQSPDGLAVDVVYLNPGDKFDVVVSEPDTTIEVHTGNYVSLHEAGTQHEGHKTNRYRMKKVGDVLVHKFSKQRDKGITVYICKR